MIVKCAKCESLRRLIARHLQTLEKDTVRIKELTDKLEVSEMSGKWASDNLEYSRKDCLLFREWQLKAEKENDELKKLLAKHQWIGSGDATSCPSCGNTLDDGHTPNCEIRKVIGKEK